MGGFKLGAKNRKAVEVREDEGAWFHVKDEFDDLLYDADEQPVRMRVAGSYSSLFNRLNEKLQRRKWAPGTTSEQISQAYREEVVAGCILEWECFEDDDGHPAKLTPALAKEAANTPWLYPQITRAMDDHKSFFKESSTNS